VKEAVVFQDLPGIWVGMQSPVSSGWVYFEWVAMLVLLLVTTTLAISVPLGYGGLVKTSLGQYTRETDHYDECVIEQKEG
jgi:hypothetical protein